MTSSEGQRPDSETEDFAEWRVRNGGILMLRLNRETGLWAGEWERLDQDAGDYMQPHTLTPEEARDLAVARDLRFADGTKADPRGRPIDQPYRANVLFFTILVLAVIAISVLVSLIV